MTAKTTQKRYPVRTVMTVVSNLISKLRPQAWQMNSLPKDVPLHLNAARRIAKSSPPQRKSPNAKSTVVKVTCAMEPKYQWSALSCCWHALS